MQDDRYKIRYRVVKAEYNFGTGSDEPHLILTLIDFKFGEGNSSYIDTGGRSGGIRSAVFLSMNKTTFNSVTGRSWDGSQENARQIAGDLEGKLFVLDLGMSNSR